MNDYGKKRTFLERVAAALEQNSEKQLAEIPALQKIEFEDEKIDRLDTNMITALNNIQKRAGSKTELAQNISVHLRKGIGTQLRDMKTRCRTL